MAGSPMVRMFRMGNSLAEEIELFNCNIREVTDAVIVFYGSFVVLVLSFCNFDVCLFFFFFNLIYSLVLCSLDDYFLYIFSDPISGPGPVGIGTCSKA
jgi:hypothetical protein